MEKLKDLKLLGNRVLIKIKRNPTKEIKRHDGTIVNLITNVDFKFGTAEDNATLKYSGEVCNVVKGSKFKIGDTVYFDRSLSVEDKTLEMDSDYVYIQALDHTTYQDEDAYTSNRRTGQRNYMHRKGEIKEQSQIYAIERDGKLYGYEDWYLVEMPDVIDEVNGIVQSTQEECILDCIAENISPKSGSLLGERLVVEKSNGLRMVVPIEINGKRLGTVAYVDILAVISEVHN